MLGPALAPTPQNETRHPWRQTLRPDHCRWRTASIQCLSLPKKTVTITMPRSRNTC